MKKVLITFYNYVLKFLTRLKKYGIIYIENKKIQSIYKYITGEDCHGESSI